MSAVSSVTALIASTGFDVVVTHKADTPVGNFAVFGSGAAELAASATLAHPQDRVRVRAVRRRDVERPVRSDHRACGGARDPSSAIETAVAARPSADNRIMRSCEALQHRHHEPAVPLAPLRTVDERRARRRDRRATRAATRRGIAPGWRPMSVIGVSSLYDGVARRCAGPGPSRSSRR